MAEKLGIIPDWQTAFIDGIPALKPNELHLWWLPLKLDPAQQKVAFDLLSPHQQGKYQRRATSQLKQAYLAGRYYLMTLLGHYAECDAEQIKLAYSRLNKPFLDQHSHPLETPLEFNFTDTTHNDQSYGLFAFCQHYAIGVDLEACSRRSKFKNIVEQRFSHEETRFVTNQYGEINPERFLAIWTRKEAYGKATGMGINFIMRERNLLTTQAEKTEHDFSHTFDFHDQQQAWRLLQIQPDDRFIASVVHSGHQDMKIKAFNALA